MSFSQEWNSIFQNKSNWSKWPWSDLISQFMRYTKNPRKNLKVLELGPGVGANIPFFIALETDYYALEGSAAACTEILTAFPSLKENVKNYDFTQSIPFNTKFDVVVDRASLTCNSENDIRRCLSHCKESLLPGGIFIGIDWYSTSHSEYHNPESEIIDTYTRTFQSGDFKGLGRVHFSDQKHLESLLSSFTILNLELKTVKSITHPNHTFSSWNFVAQS